MRFNCSSSVFKCSQSGCGNVPETCQTLLALTRLLREAQDELEPDAELSVRHVATDLLRTLATPPALPGTLP